MPSDESGPYAGAHLRLEEEWCKERLFSQKGGADNDSGPAGTGDAICGCSKLECRDVASEC